VAIVAAVVLITSERSGAARPRAGAPAPLPASSDVRVPTSET